jgi:diguanylate cyclase (GGDEF)-like protein/PAS domain S-box-containing protein
MKAVLQILQEATTVNQGKFLFPQSNNYTGLPILKTCIIGVVCFILPTAMTGLAMILHLRFLGFALCALTLAIMLSALLLWIRWYIAEFVRKIKKLMLTIHRIQSKSSYQESMIQDSTDIIFTTDIDGYILKFNKGSEMYFGYTQEDIVGTPLVNLFVNEANERKILGAVLLSGKSVNEEIPMKTKQGEIILLNLSISEMKNDYNQIIGLVVTAKDITEKKKLEMELVKKNELLSKLAITDSLTELFNVRYFYEQLIKEINRIKRTPNRKLSLMLMDIDHFKELNDTEGHQMGDSVLKALGQVIKACIRKDIDSGYRYGGDEFAVILPDTDKLHARVVADRIQKQFGAFKFGRVSLSIGIAEAKAGETEKIMVKRVDECMYRSKREGGALIIIEDA